MCRSDLVLQLSSVCWNGFDKAICTYICTNIYMYIILFPYHTVMSTPFETELDGSRIYRKYMNRDTLYCILKRTSLSYVTDPTPFPLGPRAIPNLRLYYSDNVSILIRSDLFHCSFKGSFWFITCEVKDPEMDINWTKLGNGWFISFCRSMWKQFHIHDLCHYWFSVSLVR